MTYVKPGDHVITYLSAFCGHREACTTGHPSICDGCETCRHRDQPARLYQEERTVRQFANLSYFAEQMLIHEHALVKIRDDMPLDKAALIGCGVTTGVGAVYNGEGRGRLDRCGYRLWRGGALLYQRRRDY